MTIRPEVSATPGVSDPNHQDGTAVPLLAKLEALEGALSGLTRRLEDLERAVLPRTQPIPAHSGGGQILRRHPEGD